MHLMSDSTVSSGRASSEHASTNSETLVNSKERRVTRVSEQCGIEQEKSEYMSVDKHETDEQELVLLSSPSPRTWQEK